MRSIDLNCDMGEGCSNDLELMDYVSSVNVACGLHAGNREIMQTTVVNAHERNIAIGAHPSYPDRQNFGRVQMHLEPNELHSVLVRQILDLIYICDRASAKLSHVKPHGALYNMSAHDPRVAATIASAVFTIDPELILYGLSGSASITEARALGIATASEAFADRTYQADGSLVARSDPHALIDNAEQAARQVISIIQDGSVDSVDGTMTKVFADTICIHGDVPSAVETAAAIRAMLNRYNIKVQRLND